MTKCSENFVFQTLGFITKFCAAELRIMKKYFLSLSALSMVLLACLMAVCVSSCGGDDDNDPVTPPGGGGSSKATTAYVTPCVYIAEKLLKYTNVVLTDGNNGKTYEITLSNTEVVTGKPTLGRLAKERSDFFRLVVDQYGDNLRLFKLDRATYKSFPVTVKYTVTATATANGNYPEATEKVPTFMTADVDLTNDVNGDLAGLNLGANITFSAFSGSKWESFIKSKYNPLKSSLEITLQSAERCSGSIGK